MGKAPTQREDAIVEAVRRSRNLEGVLSGARVGSRFVTDGVPNRLGASVELPENERPELPLELGSECASRVAEVLES